MKKLLISIPGILMLGSMAFAQTTSEIYQIARTQNTGSARYNGLSGAFGALGGDFTAISENAASSAVFNHSGGSVTFGYSNIDYETDYFGNTTLTNNENLNFNQIGAVMVLKNAANTRGGITKFSLGISYNKDKDFREEYFIEGSASNSIGDYFVSQANAASVDSADLLDATNFILADAYLNFYDDYGFAGQQALLGFEGGIFGISDDDVYESVITGATNQEIQMVNRGESSKTTLNMAMELDKSIYLGANLNIHSLVYEKNMYYYESNNTGDISEVWFDNSLRTVGNGVSVGVGAIAKMGKQLRIGASYNSPTYMLLEDELFQYLQTTDADGGTTVVNPIVSIIYPQYSVTMPAIVTGSAAIVFGKKGLISAQYSRQNFSEITYDYGDSDLDNLQSDAINQDIQNTFGTVNTLRVGAELRNKRWTFRGGFSNATSPYKDNSIQGETNGYSLGAGYDWGKWKLDFSYGKIVTDYNEALFENDTFSNSAAVNQTNENFTTTFSVNF